MQPAFQNFLGFAISIRWVSADIRLADTPDVLLEPRADTRRQLLRGLDDANVRRINGLLQRFNGERGGSRSHGVPCCGGGIDAAGDQNDTQTGNESAGHNTDE